MKRAKKPRLHSPVNEHSEENHGSSFDSGVEISNSGLDDVNFADSLAGKIESLHMINFMCHSNLEVSFNKRITFVTGRNGSGKSTIMAALIVVLGGTANTTGRGSGVSDFIKKGETWSKVSVTLINDGINSYKKEIYGNQITITRTLSKSSGSSYTCKSGHGVVISKKKEEIDKICAALDLQIKNPICILNQDVARTFLSATDSNVRYSMFMKATHLENLKVIYSDTIELLYTSQKEMEKKKMDVSEARKEIVRLKEKLEYLASLESYVNERTSLENEFLWSLVAAEEKNLQTLMDKKTELGERKTKYSENDSDFKSSIDKLEKEISETREKIARLGEDQSEKKIKKNDLKLKIQNLQRQIDNASVHLKQLTVKQDRLQSDINGIKEHLQHSGEVVSQNQAEKERIAEETLKLKNTLSELRDRIQTTQRDTDNAVETKLQHTMTLENLKADLNGLESSKRNLEAQIERSENVAENSLLKYGPFTPKLRDLIDEATKRNQFIKKPVGPCGLYVTLSSDNKWAPAVESVIGGLMGTYCCDNQKDFQVLTRLMDKICSGRNPQIIISKFQKARHNVSSQKVCVRGLNTVLDVLSFSNDVVYNTFIDQARIETILLFETDAQAASLLTHIQNVPKNLRMGLTVNSDQYFPAPNYRTYCGDKRPLKFFDGPVKSKAVNEKLLTDVQHTQLTVKEKKMEIAEVNNKLIKVVDFLRKTENNLRLLKQNERRIEEKLSALKNEEESKPVLSTRVVLEEELETLVKNQEKLKEKIDTEKSSIDALELEKKSHCENLELITEEENVINKEISSLQEKINESKYKLTTEKEKRQKFSEKFKEVEVELNKLMEEISTSKKSVASKIKVATDVHEERIKTDRSPVEIQKLLEKCEKYLQAAEKNTESKEKVINEYKLKYAKYKDMKAMVEVLIKVVESLSKTALSKNERFKLLQTHTANLVSFHFQACLQTRGYDGQLKFDFKNKTLELEIIPKDGLVRKDTKTLSGGERSYSMVSFILAIWRAVQMPFYFLDEFDVFMDKLNRKVIMDLLLEHAKNQTKMQFIFITPQDISSIQVSDTISIYRMPDPRK